MLHTHAPGKCAGHPCCIHNPSDHHMKTWPKLWRDDTKVMERTCPHGIGHPDPDHMTYVQSLTPAWHTTCAGPELCGYPHLEWQGIHGCDGCCAPEK